MPLDASLAYRLSLDLAERLDGALSLAGRLDRMRLGSDADACVQALIEIMQESRGIVGSALDLRRAQDGALELSIAPVLLRDLVDQISDRWRGRAEAAGVTLLTAYDGQSELAIDFDGDRLAQCLDGLIDHALARGGPGAVEAAVTARANGDLIDIAISVRDGALAGQAHVAVAGELGIALARELAAVLGGELTGGENTGAGATWTLRLCAPAVQCAARQHAAPTAALAHVLIVDDNATNRMVAEALLESFDCTSEIACDGVEAVDAVRRSRFDVVLMDIKMPNLDGLGATAAIRALPGPAGATPIVAMTANADPSDIVRYLAAGMRDVVEKPIKPERLAEALEAAIFGARAVLEALSPEALEA